MSEIELERMTDEVDHSLIEWYRSLSVAERLDAASRAAAVLAELRHAASGER